MLSKSKIAELCLIENPVDESYRNSSYDLTIGKIYMQPSQGNISELTDAIKKKLFDIDSDNTLDECEVPPQGMVVIFSQEKINLPKHICGVALPKTSLCQEGLLCLNTGIIDPFYHGYISGTIINFSKNPIYLKRGKVFLRLIFHEVTEPDNTNTYSPTSDAEYFSTIKNHANKYPHTFMNLPNHIKEVTDKVIGNSKKQILFGVGIIALAFVFINFLIPLCYLNTEKIENNVEKRIIEGRIPALMVEVENLKKNASDQTMENLTIELKRLNAYFENNSTDNTSPLKTNDSQ